MIARLRPLTWLIGLMLVVMSTLSFAQDFLPPERAFVMQARQVSPTTVAVTYKIADKYYMYRDRFGLTTTDTPWDLGLPEMPPGVVKYDPTFDQDMALYFGSVEFVLQLPAWPAGVATKPFSIEIVSQGCADAGICYPPMTSSLLLEAQGDGYSLLGQQAVVDPSSSAQYSAPAKADADRMSLFSMADDLGIAKTLQNGVLWEIVLLFFVLGALLAFTPCVLPMIPILSALIVGQKEGVTRLRGFLLAAAYVAGMSVVYTVLGVMAGLMGVGLAAWLQTPWVLILFGLVLAVLALAMFDVINIEMPASVQTRLSELSQKLPGGHMTAAVAMGAISALIVGPCVAAPLAGALLYISRTGDVVLGGGALFSMAWGMGLPLLIVGVSAGSLLPKAGAWMVGVKTFFGVLLLATAWWMASPALPEMVVVGGWILLAVFSAVLMGALEPLGQAVSRGRYFLAALRKTLGWLLLALAAIWILGLASGGSSLLRPLAHWSMLAGSTQTTTVKADLVFQPVQSLAELEQALQTSTKPVMLDFYADWCVSCKEMEAFTFTDAEVVQRMQQFTLLKADVTDNNAEHRALLRRFNLFGPPGIMFFEPGGKHLEDVRVIGFQDARNFSSSLDKVLRM